MWIRGSLSFPSVHEVWRGGQLAHKNLSQFYLSAVIERVLLPLVIVYQ